MNTVNKHIYLLFLSTIVLAQTVLGLTAEITAPSFDQILYIGDTVNITYTYDEEFETEAASAMLRISPDNGDHYFILCPIERPPDWCIIPFWATYSGDVNVAIPETVSSGDYLDDNDNPIVFSMVSDSVKILIHDYSDETLAFESEGTYSVKSKNSPINVSNKTKPSSRQSIHVRCTEDVIHIQTQKALKEFTIFSLQGEKVFYTTAAGAFNNSMHSGLFIARYSFADGTNGYVHLTH